MKACEQENAARGEPAHPSRLPPPGSRRASRGSRHPTLYSKQDFFRRTVKILQLFIAISLRGFPVCDPIWREQTARRGNRLDGPVSITSQSTVVHFIDL